MTSWSVAIPSYERAETLRTKTLPLLADRAVPRETISVFVSDSEAAEEYRSVLDPGTYGEIVVGEKGMAAARKAIAHHFPEGAALVQVDDDLRDVRRRLNDRETEPLDDLAEFFTEGFEALDVVGAGLWGIYPVLNPFFMRARMRTDLCFVSGGLFGLYNSREMVPVLDDKEDFDRTLRYYVRDGAVVRFENVGMRTTVYSGKGGMQGDRPHERNEASVQWLARKYPSFVSVTRRKSGWAEVRLRDRSKPLVDILP